MMLVVAVQLFPAEAADHRGNVIYIGTSDHRANSRIGIAGDEFSLQMLFPKRLKIVSRSDSTPEKAHGSRMGEGSRASSEAIAASIAKVTFDSRIHVHFRIVFGRERLLH